MISKELSLPTKMKRIAKLKLTTGLLISAIWVIVHHRKQDYHPKTSLEKFLKKLQSSGQISVDTFLACSGILVSQSFLRMFERYGKLKIKTQYDLSNFLF